VSNIVCGWRGHIKSYKIITVDVQNQVTGFDAAENCVLIGWSRLLGSRDPKETAGKTSTWAVMRVGRLFRRKAPDNARNVAQKSRPNSCCQYSKAAESHSRNSPKCAPSHKLARAGVSFFGGYIALFGDPGCDIFTCIDNHLHWQRPHDPGLC